MGFVQKQLKDMKQDNYIDDQNALFQVKAEKEKAAQGKAQFEQSVKTVEKQTKRTLADRQSLFQL